MDPAAFPQSVTGPGFAVSALAYEPGGDGFDYRNARFTPVLLALKSSGRDQPQVIVEDVRGVTQGGEYLPYTPSEAASLAARDLSIAQGTKTACLDGFVGAIIGGGLGALAGFALGKDPDSLWIGAAAGAAAGGAYGAVFSRPPSRPELARAIADDLDAQAWREDPLAPGSIRLGYLYLPAKPKPTALRLLIRGTREGDIRVSLPIVSPKDLAQSDGAAADQKAPLAPRIDPAPARTPAPEAHSAPPADATAKTAARGERSPQAEPAEAVVPNEAEDAPGDDPGMTVADTDRDADRGMTEENDAPVPGPAKAPQRVSQDRGRTKPDATGQTTPRRRAPNRPAPVRPAPEGITI